ncbi:MAG: hypothetical protein LAP38_18760 [Acidobacteriia bacterium]|nr:hypothetical protein [Terriglobia bacterium]
MAFCQNCGSPVDGRFCQKCGAAVGGGAPNPAPGPTPGSAPGAYPPAANVGISDNVAGALCYLVGFITGILFLVLAPYNQNRNVRFHAFQSIFLNVAWFVCWIVLTIVGIALHVIPVLGTMLMILLNFALGIGSLIVWIYMMIKTYNGERIVLPVIGSLAEQQAGN